MKIGELDFKDINKLTIEEIKELEGSVELRRFKFV